MGRTDTGAVPTCGRNARVGIQTRNRAEIIIKQTLFYISGSDFASNRPCFEPAGQTLPQTDPVLHQRVRLYSKQTLFYTSGSDFASNRPCFTPAGQTLPQTDPVLHQRVRLYPKQTLDENKILIPIPEAFII